MSDDRWQWPRARLAQRLLRLAARLVPSSRRAEWQQIWEGELWALVHERYPGAPGPLHFTLGSFRAALSEWLHEWGAASLACDMRRSWTRLRAAPAHAAFALLIITVGVSANTSIFTLVSATLVSVPPHLREPERLVQIGRATANGDLDHLSFPNYVDIRDRSGAFSGLAAYGRVTSLAQTPTDAIAVTLHAVSANFFQVVGTSPARGRVFTAADRAVPVAVVSDGLWRRHYAATPHIVGERLLLEGVPFTIVGVAPERFVGPDVAGTPPDAWVTLHAHDAHLQRLASLEERGHSWLSIVGRLAPGVTHAQAHAELKALHARLARMSAMHAGTLSPALAVVPGVGFRPDERAEAERVSALLMTVVGALLLIACANLAGLQSARAVSRRRDLGICAAVGASSLRLTRELVAEQLTLAAAGAVLAWVSTWWTARAVQALLPYKLTVTLSPDWRVFAFAVAVATVTTLFFSVGPARRSARVDVIATLRGGSAAGGARVAGSWLAGTQVALTFALLIGAGLLVRSIVQARSSDPGFAVDRVTAVPLKLDLLRRRGDAGASGLIAAVDGIRQVPGVTSVALASHPPLAVPQRTRSIRLPGTVWGDEPPAAAVNTVSVEYFRTMDIHVRRGRTFDGRDVAPGAAPVVILSESAARLLGAAGDVVGQRVDVGRTAEVVGVVADVKLRTLTDRNVAAVYLPLSGVPSDLTLLVRGGQSRVADAAVVALRAAAPEAVVIAAAPLRALLGRTYAETRMVATLLVIFAGIAALLAAAGVYGVLALWVSERRCEMAVRLALGATRGELATLVVRRIAPPVIAGLGAGAVLAVVATRALRTLLFGITSLDPVSYVTAGLILVAITVIAACVPARRAMRADPMLTLKGV